MASNCLKFLLFVVIISVFVPFSPKMPSASLDASWALALNQAVAQGLSFGKDIIFTLGPYSAMYTKAYHPATDLMMMGGTAYLAISYWFCFIFLMRGVKGYWTLLFCLLLFTMIYARDVLFFSYPLLVGLATLKLSKCDENRYTPFYVALFFAPFGLLVLVKGSFLLLCLAIEALGVLILVSCRKNQLGLIGLFSPVISVVLFWLIAGQPIGNLLSYFGNSMALAAYFTEAMSTPGSNVEVASFLLTSVCILFFIAWQKDCPKFEKLFLLAIFFVFLFISYKAAFTRQLGHAFIASSSIILAALLLFFIFSSNLLFLWLLMALNTWYFINSHYTQVSLFSNFKSTFYNTWFGLKHRLANPQYLRQDFALSLEFLSKQASFPKLSGTTDVYSAKQSYLISSQTTWSPRPIFQSYSVFNANFAEKNRQHLQGETGPDNIIFRIEPIDNRFPTLEDGRSWPHLLTHYQPIHFANDFLFLQKRLVASSKPLTLATRETHFLGDVIAVPDVERFLFARIEIKPSFWGRLAIFFFKPQQLAINLVLANGEKRQFRLVAGMAKAGFLLSPLVENTTEFATLFTDKWSVKKIKTLQIVASESPIPHWHKKYFIHFKPL